MHGVPLTSLVSQTWPNRLQRNDCSGPRVFVSEPSSVECGSPWSAPLSARTFASVRVSSVLSASCVDGEESLEEVVADADAVVRAPTEQGFVANRKLVQDRSVSDEFVRPHRRERRD